MNILEKQCKAECGSWIEHVLLTEGDKSLRKSFLFNSLKFMLVIDIDGLLISSVSDTKYCKMSIDKQSRNISSNYGVCLFEYITGVLLSCLHRLRYFKTKVLYLVWVFLDNPSR